MKTGNSISTIRARVFLGFLAITLLASAVSMAETKIWTGGGENANVSNPDNWSGGAPADGDAWEFGAVGASGYTIVNDYGSGTSNSGITFTQDATGTYTIAPNWTRQTGDIVNNSSFPQNVFLGHELHNDITINAANEIINIAQNNTINLNFHNLTIDGNHDTSLAIHLGGTGTVAINQGAALQVSAGIADSVQTVTINQGGVLRFANHDTLGNHLSQSPVQIIADGGMVCNAPGWFTTINHLTLKNGGDLIDNTGHDGWLSFQLVNEFNVTADSTLAANQISTIAIGTEGAYNGVIPYGVNFNVADVTRDASTDLLVSARLRDGGRRNEGGGNFTKTGAGTMELTNVNEITGNVTISDGILKLSGNGTIGYGSVINNATLEFAYDSDQTFGNAISGAGNVVKSGNSTLTLTQAPGYTGSTLVESGTLALAQGGTLYNLSGGSVNDDGSVAVAAAVDASGKELTIDNAVMTTFVGSIKAQSILKTGYGTLKIYADEQNKVVADTFTVSASELDYKGYFEGSLEVVNGAFFSPGNSIGEANVTGNVAFITNNADSNGFAYFEFGDFTGADENHDLLVLSASSLFNANDEAGVVLLDFANDDASDWASSGVDYLLVKNGAFENGKDYTSWLTPTFTDLFSLQGRTNGLYLIGLAAPSQPGSGVPEPSTWALLILGVAGLFLRKRKNERR